MDWFTSLLLISALILFLWLCAGIYLDIRQRLQHANERASKEGGGVRRGAAAQADMWNNITTSQVREAFDLFLGS